jgi:hypothetical protein
MKAFRLAVLLVVSAVVASFAGETNTLPTTITVDGITYSNVIWRTVTPATVSIFHQTGVASIPLEKLPPELQKRFGYDPQKAREYYQETKEREAVEAVRRQEASQLAKAKADYEAAHHEALESIEKSAIEIQGKVQQITADGALISGAVTPYTYVRQSVADPNYHTILGGPVVTTSAATAYKNVTDEDEPIFVLGAGQGFNDGAPWSAKVYPSGTYKYVTVMGAEKTVKCFTLSAEDALRRALE